MNAEPAEAGPGRGGRRRPTRLLRNRARSNSPSAADELLRPVRLRPANTLAAGSERLCRAVRQLGFHAAVAEVGDGAAVIETATCPLRPLVRECSGVAEIDCGMWIGLAARALEGAEPARIECETHSCHGDGFCCVSLTLSAK